LSKRPFRETDRLLFKRVYLSSLNLKSSGIGFYSDGRMVYFFAKGNNELTENEVTRKSWNTTTYKYIGYWRVENDEIRVEYFLCGNSGVYIEKKGKINGDTIVFYQNFSLPFKNDIREERYVVSNMSFD
jgi:hypothetical protein